MHAAGDAADTAGWKLTPVAVHEGLIAASNLLEGNRKTPDDSGTPSVAFSLPALARAGLSEAEASAQGLEFKVNGGDSSGGFTSRRMRERPAGFKVLVEKGSVRILGAHLLGMHAGETIDMLALAIRHRLTARDVEPWGEGTGRGAALLVLSTQPRPGHSLPASLATLRLAPRQYVAWAGRPLRARCFRARTGRRR